MLEISVNLATHNRAAFLEPCLIGLCEQTLDPSRYEICVVANACTDETPEVVAKIAALYPRHRIFMVSEPVPGLSRARNCGLRATTAPLIADIDDDAVAYPDLLQRYIDRFNELGPNTAVIGGEIEPVWGAPKPSWLTEKMQSFLTAGTGLGLTARYLVGDECLCECNSCYRRTALSEVGNFPEELGRIGACLLSGENVIESFIRKQGGRVFFDPDIVLRHYIHADRLNPLWLRQRFFWQGISGFAVRQYQIQHSVPVTGDAYLQLPLEREEWAFLGKDTSENLETSLFLFQSLGFALALTGIIPTESQAP